MEDVIQIVESQNGVPLHYDEETDTLYISFYKPQRANDTILEDNNLYHYRDDELVGLAILRASVTFGATSQEHSE